MNDDAQRGPAFIAQKERNRDGLSGLELHAAGSAIEISIDGHPDPTDFWRWTGPGLRKVIEGTGYEILECRGVMGLAASGMHLFQDGLLRKVPRPARPILAFLLQFAVGACDWLSSDAERANDACVFVVVARKKKRI